MPNPTSTFTSLSPSPSSSISPADCGLPSKFHSFRPSQLKALDFLLDSSSRFKALAMPTGSGKSPLYVAYSLLTGKRAVCLTSTRGLQDQLLDDFSECGMVDIRGRENYSCYLGPAFNCSNGSVAKCHHQKLKSCPYVQQVEAAKESSLVVTNYSYWTAAMTHGRGLGTVDTLILDEGHEAMDEITSAAGIELSAKEVLSMMGVEWPYDTNELSEWVLWANEHVDFVRTQVRRMEESIATSQSSLNLNQLDQMSQWKNLLSKLETLQIVEGEWIIHPTKRSSWKLDPLWPSQHAERVLFHGIPEVIVVSATLTDKTLDLLGCNKDQRSYMSFPSPFSPQRSPLYHVPTIQVSRRSTPDQIRKWISHIDLILESRSDRRGIIHTVSYERAVEIMSQSRFSHRFLSNTNSRNTAETLELFGKSPYNTVLVSPSVTTGYDFAYSLCEFQIIGKLPFPDGRDPLTKARSDSDDSYTGYLTTMNLVQMHGRGMRYEDDRCETFIVDDQISWFRGKYNHFFPAYLRGRISRIPERNKIPHLPPPPPKVTPPEWWVKKRNGFY